jgi:hypothetical protein
MLQMWQVCSLPDILLTFQMVALEIVGELLSFFPLFFAGVNMFDAKQYITGTGETVQSTKDIERISTLAGSHFFETETLRFFESRIDIEVYPVSGMPGVFLFVTSEQHKCRIYGDYPRMYTVRKWDASNPASFDTVGEFQEYETRHVAHSAASRMAHTGDLSTGEK